MGSVSTLCVAHHGGGCWCRGAGRGHGDRVAIDRGRRCRHHSHCRCRRRGSLGDRRCSHGAHDHAGPPPPAHSASPVRVVGGCWNGSKEAVGTWSPSRTPQYHGRRHCSSLPTATSWVIVICGHLREVVDFPYVDDDPVFDTSLQLLGGVSVTCTKEDEASSALVVKISHITFRILLGSSIHAHNSMPRVSIRCSRSVSTHWSEEVRPTIRSTSSSCQACLGMPSRMRRTL